MARREQINAWLEEHGVEQAIAGAVDSAVRAQAADPIQHIAGALSKSESSEVAMLRKANEEQAAELESLRAEMRRSSRTASRRTAWPRARSRASMP